MLRLAILLAAVACALGAAIPDGLLPQSNGGRIVGGSTTTISEYAWQVSLQRNGAHSCGACIYSVNIAITAAHCLQNVNIKVMRVRAGSSFWHSGGVTIPVAAFLNHEEYNATTKNSDIAIIRLEFSLTFSSTIKPIPLATVAPPTGTSAVISGWGTIHSGSNSLPTILQYTSSFVVDWQECGSPKYNYGPSKIDHTMICAASYNKDACQGDSGGPMVSGGELVGVVSWGTACALDKYPGVYANVAVLKSWVEKSVKTI